MPLSPEVIARAERALSGPFSILRVNPDATDVSIRDACETLADALHDFLSIVGSCADSQAVNSLDPHALARLLWLHGNLFALYRALVEKRP